MSPSWLHRNTEDQSDTAKAHHHGNGSCGQAQAQARRPVSIKLKTARVVRCTVVATSCSSKDKDKWRILPFVGIDNIANFSLWSGSDTAPGAATKHQTRCGGVGRARAQGCSTSLKRKGMSCLSWPEPRRSPPPLTYDNITTDRGG
ncbi:hypothetical protein BM1_02666 [Bipolaris maydis]|nr:hypothetical protein BM1_02666 [Bipolaris maydis]